MARSAKRPADEIGSSLLAAAVPRRAREAKRPSPNGGAPRKSGWRRWAFRALPSAAVLAILAMAWRHYHGDPIERGQEMHVRAFEAAFRERGLPVPPQGPREGLWGARLGDPEPHPLLGWHQRPVNLPPLIVMDRNGMQHRSSSAPSRLRIMIVGGSVGMGACASAIETTYFAWMARRLEAAGYPAEISVAAAGAWKSGQEVDAFGLFAPQAKPDLAIFLDGLNDLTNGAYAATVHGEPALKRDGSAWTPDYHAGDYEDRIRLYLENMKRGFALARGIGAEPLAALQPSLAEKRSLTRLEQELLRNSVYPSGTKKAFQASYSAMRAGLRALEAQGSGSFLDASNVFGAENETTFMDMWHFPDPGHELLGNALADKILGMIKDGRLKPR